jgi:hypothetical protein
MRQKLSMVALIAIAVLGLSVALIQADFLQCVALANCPGSDNPDLINGSQGDDIIRGFDGGDTILGNAGDDNIGGDDGNDVIFGGLGADSLHGRDGNDILLAGPDLPDAGQLVFGSDDNDTANVFVTDVTYCLIVDLGDDTDLVNLIGFGPYTAVVPFGQAGFVEGWAYLQDPITGGDIYIFVEEATSDGAETINGLLSPNVVILAEDAQEVDDCRNNTTGGSAPGFSQPSPGP